MLTSKDIQRLEHATQMQIVHWTELGIIVPCQDAHGRGRRRLYDENSAVDAQLASEMRAWGLECHAIKRILSKYRTGKLDDSIDCELAKLAVQSLYRKIGAVR